MLQIRRAVETKHTDRLVLLFALTDWMMPTPSENYVAQAEVMARWIPFGLHDVLLSIVLDETEYPKGENATQEQEVRICA